MFRILFFSDPHNSDSPPRMRKEGYREQILAKQEKLIEPAQHCDFVICGGDVFHQKDPKRVSYSLMNRLMEIYREFPKTFIVPGNHDFDRDIGEIMTNQLAILAKLPNVKIVHRYYDFIEKVQFVFWGGGDFLPHPQLLSYLEEFKKEDVFRVVVAHAPITTKNYPFPVIHLSDVNEDADLFLVGHIHDYQENEGRIIAPGALSRGVLKWDETLERKVQYAVLTFKEDRIRDVMMRDLFVESVEDVFKIEEKKEQKEIEASVQTFLEYLDKFEIPKTMDKEQLIEQIKKADVPPEVRYRALKILEELNGH